MISGLLAAQVRDRLRNSEGPPEAPAVDVNVAALQVRQARRRLDTLWFPLVGAAVVLGVALAAPWQAFDASLGRGTYVVSRSGFASGATLVVLRGFAAALVALLAARRSKWWLLSLTACLISAHGAVTDMTVLAARYRWTSPYNATAFGYSLAVAAGWVCVLICAAAGIQGFVLARRRRRLRRARRAAESPDAVPGAAESLAAYLARRARAAEGASA